MTRLAAAITLTALCGSCIASIPYNNDFQIGAGPEWSDPLIDTAPMDGQKILGQFTNQTVTLTLPALAGEHLTLAFDFCAIRSWDGNAGGGGPGPDTFSVAISGGPTLVSATFSVGNPDSPHTMSYPGPGDYPSRTGASANDSLGYDWRGGVLDATWHMEFAIVAPSDSLNINFSASGLQSINDESWGLDNVHVSSLNVPSPGPLALLGFALVRRRRR